MYTGRCLREGSEGPLEFGYRRFLCLRYGSHLLWRFCGESLGVLGGVDLCTSPPADVCQLPKPDPNQCSYVPGEIPGGAWYDAATGRCEPLDYGGCEDANAFLDREQCEAACVTPDAGVAR